MGVEMDRFALGIMSRPFEMTTIRGPLTTTQTDVLLENAVFLRDMTVSMIRHHPPDGRVSSYGAVGRSDPTRLETTLVLFFWWVSSGLRDRNC